MQTELLFYPAFLGQIIVLSLHLPRKALDRVSYVQSYPPSEFPNLYPGPIEKYDRARQIYRRLNTVILLAGLVLLAVLLGRSRSGKWDSAIVTWFYMLQISPLLLVEIWAIRYYRLMRRADTRTTQKAELQPRRLADFISLRRPRVFLDTPLT